jgi:hypothetical protein
MRNKKTATRLGRNKPWQGSRWRGDRKYWSHWICCRRMTAYASSIYVAGDDLRHTRLAHKLRRVWYLRKTREAQRASQAPCAPSIPSRTVSQRARYATMRFAESRPLPACSATLFCSCPAFPTSSARAVASAFPRTVLKPFALKTAECYMPAMTSPR